MDEPDAGMMLRTLKLLASYRKRFAVALVMIVTESILLVSIPPTVSQITDTLMVALTPGMAIDADRFWSLAGWLSFMVVANAFTAYLGKYLMATVANSAANDLRQRINDKVDDLPLNDVEENASQKAVAYISVDSDSLSNNLQLGLGTLILSVAVIISCTVSMVLTEWRLALSTIIFVVVGQAVVTVLLKRSRKYTLGRIDALAEMTGAINEFYVGRPIVQLYRGMPDVEKTFDTVNEEIRRNEFNANTCFAFMAPIMSLASNLGIAATCIIASMLYINGEMSFGVIPAFLLYVTIFTTYVASASKACSYVQFASISAKRIFDFLDRRDEENNGKESDPAASKGCIEFRNVTFGYETDRPVINNISFRIEPGTHIALVGATGCGKSTILNILQRFYDIQDGSVLVDGTDIRKLDRRSVRSLFTTVPQDPWVFNGTLRENIRFNSTASDAALLRICEITGLTEVFQESSSILDERISSGGGLSYGQKQMISVARTMARDAPIVLLDEATSSVDSITEQRIIDALKTLVEGRTSVTIAHRLSTIIDSDRIILMGGGGILEDGTHDELMKRNGRYAMLFRDQFDNKEKME